MVTCNIAYFSQSGSTAKIADMISRQLEEIGWFVKTSNLAENSAPTESSDVLGIGTPTFFFHAPSLVTEFIDGLPNLDGRPFFVFALYSLHIGDTGNDIRKKLLEKGGRDIGYFKSRGTNHFPGYTRKGVLFCPENPSKEELDDARGFANQVAKRYQDEHVTVEQFDPSPPVMYRLERLASNRWLTDHLLSRTFVVDKDACINCGTCVDACPTNNIELDEEGFPKWGQNCILCLSCEIACPEDAVSSMLDSSLMSPIIKYNISQGKDNPDVCFEKI
ncbi:MAG: EFR1 family ferrodoxin [Candidatus Thorarchaeota archaeon]|nr:EFR1 family ferrodoxin [Candidatus Thorarchaeota archaeon]